MRNSQAIDEEMDHGSRKRGKNPPPAPTSSLQRGKTMSGRKLRVMTVEKGLLRETKVVQKMVDVLVECRVRPQNMRHDAHDCGACGRLLAGGLGGAARGGRRCGDPGERLEKELVSMGGWWVLVGRWAVGASWTVGGGGGRGRFARRGTRRAPRTCTYRR